MGWRHRLLGRRGFASVSGRVNRQCGWPSGPAELRVSVARVNGPVWAGERVIEVEERRASEFSKQKRGERARY